MQPMMYKYKTEQPLLSAAGVFHFLYVKTEQDFSTWNRVFLWQIKASNETTKDKILPIHTHNNINICSAPAFLHFFSKLEIF